MRQHGRGDEGVVPAADDDDVEVIALGHQTSETIGPTTNCLWRAGRDRLSLRTMSQSTGEQIAATVGSWPGVESAPHRFGGVEFRVGRRELGHLHGDRIADLPFPRRVRDELIAEGRARPHHVLPDSGWITVSIRSPSETENAVELFRMAYARANKARVARNS